MNIFTRLLRLYKSSSINTPLEDFTTEILIGILSQDNKLLDSFVNQILGIEGESFRISSQEYFLSDEGIQNCKVDIIIRNDEVLCLLENKVESSEGHEQLYRYGKILEKYQTDYKTHLRYCTKYYDFKEINQHQFAQFRWSDVSKFLKKNNNSELIKEYLTFLKENNMDSNTTFSAIDILTLENLSPLVSRMEVYLDKIKPSFIKHFGSIKNISNYDQIKRNSRCIFIKEAPFGTGYNEIGVGFDFKKTAHLTVWIWCGKQNSKYLEFKNSINTQSKIQNNEEDWIAINKPLTDFLSSDNIELEIEEWFINSFKQIKEFATDNSNLDWNFELNTVLAD